AGVPARHGEGAVRGRWDSRPPYGEAEVAWGWSRVPFGAVLLGIARRETVERYVALFVEAGIAAASFTFPAAAIHAAIRLNGAAAEGHAGGGFIALSHSASGAVEGDGESAARP